MLDADELAAQLAHVPRVRDALRVLIDDGLANRLGDRVGLSRAAVRFDALSPISGPLPAAFLGPPARLPSHGLTRKRQPRTSAAGGSASTTSSTRAPIVRARLMSERPCMLAPVGSGLLVRGGVMVSPTPL
jgi:hypothetical protein